MAFTAEKSASAAFDLLVGQVLQSNSTAYTILQFIGEGAFGKVAKCLNHDSKEIVAVKILKAGFAQDVENELFMLQTINQLNADKVNVVKFHERFQYSGLTCLVFEMLDRDFFHLLIKEGCGSMYVDQIRPVAKQMLMALEALQSLGIMHTDIKPDNVMLVDMENLPCKAKLIDFGLAFPASEARPGDLLQPVGYRAPEVSLGLPYNEAIDMWGLGCTLAFLYTGWNLFPVNCPYQMMKHMVAMLGMPSHHQLKCGKNTWRFFIKVRPFGTKWRLLTAQEYSQINNTQAQEWPSYLPRPNSLDDLLRLKKAGETAELEDMKAFVDFLKQLLQMDDMKRISPSEALQHPFISMSHLRQDPRCRDYLVNAENIMSIVELEDSPTTLTSTSPLEPPSEHNKAEETCVPEDWESEYRIHSLKNVHKPPEETYIPKDWESEYHIRSSTNGHKCPQELHIPEDWESEYQDHSSTTGHNRPQEVYVPEDWESEYRIHSLKNAHKPPEETYIPEDWEMEYLIYSSKFQPKRLPEVYVPENWENEYQNHSSTDGQKRLRNSAFPKAWRRNIGFILPKNGYKPREETYIPEDWEREYLIYSSKNRHKRPQEVYVPKDWEKEYLNHSSTHGQNRLKKRVFPKAGRRTLGFTLPKNGHKPPEETYIPENWESEYQNPSSIDGQQRLRNPAFPKAWRRNIGFILPKNRHNPPEETYIPEDWESEYLIYSSKNRHKRPPLKW